MLCAQEKPTNLLNIYLARHSLGLVPDLMIYHKGGPQALSYHNIHGGGLSAFSGVYREEATVLLGLAAQAQIQGISYIIMVILSAGYSLCLITLYGNCMAIILSSSLCSPFLNIYQFY